MTDQSNKSLLQVIRAFLVGIKNAAAFTPKKRVLFVLGGDSMLMHAVKVLLSNAKAEFVQPKPNHYGNVSLDDLGVTLIEEPFSSRIAGITGRISFKGFDELVLVNCHLEDRRFETNQLKACPSTIHFEDRFPWEDPSVMRRVAKKLAANGISMVPFQKLIETAAVYELGDQGDGVSSRVTGESFA